MMLLRDVRDYVASLNLADHVYEGRLDNKFEKSFGVYNSRHTHEYRTALGGPQNESYGLKYVTILVHWNKSPDETEKASQGLLYKLCETRNVTVNNSKILFVQPLSDIVPVDTDDHGTCEMVIEAAFVFEKGR